MNTQHILKNKQQIKEYMFAGNAIITILNEVTGKRFTFKVSKPLSKKNNFMSPHYINVLVGGDNEYNYSFIGTVFLKNVFKHSDKSLLNKNSLSVKAFAWFIDVVNTTHELATNIKVFHSGQCGRCGRTLTVPESILSGLGPECEKKKPINYQMKLV